MLKKYKRILAVFLAIMICLPSLNVNASQSRGGNFNKNYSLNGSPADNIVSVAMAQQGKTKAQLGYTEAWCADFVSDCARLSGSEDIIPFDGYCLYLYNKVKNAGGYDVSSPQKGDLVFYYCSACNVHWCHVGLMIDSQRSIEGNYGGKVSVVNGIYRDGSGHSLYNGIVTRKFVRPAYKVSVPSLNTVQLSIAGSTTEFQKGNGITFNWTWGGSEADGYELFYAKKIEGTNEYDWNNAKRAFFPGNAAASGTISSVLSEGTYAAYMQSCAPNDKRGGQSNFVYFHVYEVVAQWGIWISKSKMGRETEVVPNGKPVYLCYQIIDKHTKKNWDELYQSAYRVKETVVNPDGAEVFSYTYTNDNNWIMVTPMETGEYKGIVEVSGSFAGQTVNKKQEYNFIVKNFYYGDINADNDITVTDLSMVNQAAKNTVTLSADQKKRADVNADGKITDEDVTLMKEYIVGTITEFPAESHIHIYDNKVTREATCTDTGIRTFYCVCGESFTRTIPKTGHTPVTDQAVAATCTRSGKTQGSHCGVCGKVIIAQKTVAATGHVHTEVRNAREATASSYGYTGDVYCKDCGIKVSVDKVIEKKQGATEAEENAGTDTDDSHKDYEDDEIDETEEEEDDSLEEGDMLYDASGKAEYEVTRIAGNTVFVSYNATLNKKQKVITVPNQITTEDGVVCKVTAVSERAFSNVKSVRRIVLGDHITKIGARAFTGCKKLSSLTIKSKEMTSKSLSRKAFKGISSKAKIKVPKEKRNFYKKLFFNKGLSKKVKVCNL